MITALLVEDDADLSELVAEFLEVGGCTVTTVFSPEEAMAHVQDNRSYKLLFTDYRFPSMLTGIQLADEIRQLIPEIQVVVATGYDPVTIEAEADEQYHIINKPFHMQDVVRLMGRLFSTSDC